MTAGSRNAATTRRLPHFPSAGRPAEGVGAASGVTAGVPNRLLLERLGGSRLECAGRAVDVGRVLQEVPEDLPLTLTWRAAERRRREVRHVEAERLGLGELRCCGACDRVGVRARWHVLVRRRDAA